MKIKTLIFAIILLATSIFVSSVAVSVVFKDLNDPAICSDCHVSIFTNYTVSPDNQQLLAHKEKNITCQQCHSSLDPITEQNISKLLLEARITRQTLSMINVIMVSNFTFNQSFNVSRFSILKANCSNCHNITKIQSVVFNHSGLSGANLCERCHFMHNKSTSVEAGLWKRMGSGGHRNLTCSDCHGTEPTRFNELPQCTKCHIPHQKDAQWDRSICLGCHDNPHIPQKNATFKGNLTKEMCATCHNNIYQILTTYNSKHNEFVPACINCHPKHIEARSCGVCHAPHGPLHSGSQCDSCHRYVNGCKDCHTNPHAPRRGIPSIRTEDQWKEFAIEVGKKG